MSIDIQLAPKEKVVRTVEKWIRKGILPPESAMPSEDELSRNLKVSRGTIRTGLELLEERGLLYKQNRRRYVAKKQETIPEATPLHQTVLLLGVTADNPLEYKDTGFLQAVQAGTLDALSTCGTHALSMHADKLDSKDLQSLLNMKPRGAVLFQDFLKTEEGLKTALLIKKRGTPVVADYVRPELNEFDCVICDHENSNYLLTKHLINRDCKDILCFYPSSGNYWFESKYTGYANAMREAGLKPMLPVNTSEKPQYYNRTKESFEEFVRLYAGFMVEHFTSERPPQAILASSDWDVPVIASACRLFGKEPGKDVLIGGYDNKNESSPWRPFDQSIPCVTVDKNNTKVGRELIKLLDRRINNELPEEPVKVQVPGKIIIL